MKIRTQLKAGRIGLNHNERLQIRSALKAGSGLNHNEALVVRTALKAGSTINHNEPLRHQSDRPTISMRRQVPTTVRREDRLELLVVRAGLRAGFARMHRIRR